MALCSKHHKAKDKEGANNVLFLELLQVAVGVRSSLSCVPTAQDWAAIYHAAKMQAVTGVAFHGVHLLYQNKQEQLAFLPVGMKLQWLGLHESLRAYNKVVNGAVSKLLADEALADCHKVILKGQAVAKYYPHPELRNPGDIDIWCVCRGMTLKESLWEMARRAISKVPDAGMQPHHTDWPEVDGVSVELHFTPSTVYSFFYNRRVQRYFEENLPRCKDNRLPIDVDIVFQLMHLRRHLISEGVGLRQVMDLYWTLKAYSLQCRRENVSVSSSLETTLKRLGLFSFAQAMMWVLQEVFLMPTEELLCAPNKKRGRFVLGEMLKGGNFGKWSTQNGEVGDNRMQHLWYYVRLAMRCLRYFTRESVCAPMYRVYVGVWNRKFNSLR